MWRAGAQTVLFDLFVFPKKYLSSGSFNSPKTYLHQFPIVSGVGDVARVIPYLLIYSLVPYVYFYGLYNLWKKRSVLPRVTWQQMLLLNLTGLALFLAISNGPRFFRISTVAPPAILVFVWLLRQPSGVSSILRKMVWSTAMAFALWLPVHRQMQWHSNLSLPIGKTAFISAGQLEEFQWLKERTHPGDRFFNDYFVGLYLQLENPATADLVNNDDYTRPVEVTSILQSLRDAPPKFVVLNPESMRIQGEHDHSGPYQDFVLRHYCPSATFQYDPDSNVQEIWGACSNASRRTAGGD
jgi:hypothetical protein